MKTDGRKARMCEPQKCESVDQTRQDNRKGIRLDECLGREKRWLYKIEEKTFNLMLAGIGALA